MKRMLLIFGAASLIVMSAWGTPHCQEDVKFLADPAYGTLRRGPVPFNHEMHNEKAKLTDCKTCHHLYKNGKLDPAGDSVGTKCSECHAVKGGKKAIPLTRAYHIQCGKCHEAKGAGPVTCGQCHPGKGVKQ